MKATKTTRSNTTLKVWGFRNGRDEALVLDFATEELARDAEWKLQGTGIHVDRNSTTTRYCDADKAVADALSFFTKEADWTDPNEETDWSKDIPF